jgi:hypothetical protein
LYFCFLNFGSTGNQFLGFDKTDREMYQKMEAKKKKLIQGSGIVTLQTWQGKIL